MKRDVKINSISKLVHNFRIFLAAFKKKVSILILECEKMQK